MDRAREPQLTLDICGPFRAAGPKGEVSGLSRRAQAILAVLSEQPDMCAERGYLAALLWSDRAEEQARSSLRQELSLLRKALPDGILTANRQFVRLDPSRVAMGAPDRGTYLQGFDLPSAGFEEWLRETRASCTPDDVVPAARPFAARPAVLLLAFDTISPGDQDEMIARGLSSDLVTTLSYWRWFPIIGPDAIGWKTAKEADLRALASDVGASYVVTGTLGCLGERIRVSVGLVSAETGRSLWSEAFDGTLEDIFAFQEAASRAIVARLEPQIARADAARIERAHPASIGPWQLLARADEVDRRGGEGYGTPESNREQVRLMEAALDMAPDFAPALARIGRAHFRAGLLGWRDDRDACYAESLEWTGRALERDPDNWEAHALHGLARIFGTREYPVGRFHAGEAVRLNPSAALARHALSCALEWLGDPEESLEHLHVIFRLNPCYPGRAPVWGGITTCEMFIGRQETSVEAARQLMGIAPTYARGLQRCVATFGYFGETAVAEEALQGLLRLQPDFEIDYVRATYPYARENDLAMLIEGFEKAGAFAPG